MSSELAGHTATPRLEVRAADQRWIVEPGRPFTIGREGVDAVLADGRVSRLHLVLEPTPQGWVLQDRSSNGSYLDGRRIGRMPLTGPVTVQLGVPPNGVAVSIALAATAPPPGTPSAGMPVQSPPSAVHRIGQSQVTIGRLPDNDVVLNDLLVSRRHAQLLRGAGGTWEIVDLRSDNGTYVNGRRITRTALNPGDVVGIGHQQLHLVDDRLEAYVDTGDIGFSAVDLSVITEEGKRILDGVSFVLPERSLLAVVGPSGSGKSTLLNALTGFRPATHGQVVYGGRDLYVEYDELRNRIGLVPQDDILHSQLSVRRALSYSAELRFPQDVPAPDRDRRVDEVLHELSLRQHAEKKITQLSGGQRKRTSVALELLTKPSLLFLDEPTSGLDPGMDKSVMQTLRGLADDGRTVVVVTHAMQNVNLCDRLLILGRGGQLAFFGPPQEALAYFGQEDFAEIFLLLDQESNVDWGARFKASPYFQRYIVGPSQRRRPPRPPAQQFFGRPDAAKRQQSATRQFSILCRRYLALIASDRQFAFLLFLLPIALGLLSVVIPGDAGFSVLATLAPDASSTSRQQPTILLLVLIVFAMLTGSFLSVREITKEQAIYRRERAIGLSQWAYLSSKVIVLGVLVLMQGLIIGFLGTVFQDAPDDALVLGSARAEIVVAVCLAGLVSMFIGLLISAALNNADQGILAVVGLTAVQLLLSGGLFPVNSVILNQFSWLFPSRWAFAMGAATEDLNAIKPPDGQDGLWDHTAGNWIGAVFVLLIQATVVVVVTGFLLRRFDPKRRSGVQGGAPVGYRPYGPPPGHPGPYGRPGYPAPPRR